MEKRYKTPAEVVNSLFEFQWKKKADRSIHLTPQTSLVNSQGLQNMQKGIK